MAVTVAAARAAGAMEEAARVAVVREAVRAVAVGKEGVELCTTVR